jgi:hypothetical protein
MVEPEWSGRGTLAHTSCQQNLLPYAVKCVLTLDIICRVIEAFVQYGENVVAFT